jgi:hypothetical protein
MKGTYHTRHDTNKREREGEREGARKVEMFKKKGEVG